MYLAIVRNLETYLDELYNSLTDDGYTYILSDKLLELEEEIKYELDIYPHIVSESFAEIVSMRESLTSNDPISDIYDLESSIDELTCLIKEYACTPSFRDTYSDERITSPWENSNNNLLLFQYDECLDEEFATESKKRVSEDVERAKAIYAYICNAKGIVTRDKILVQFPNTSIRALNYALSREDILSYDSMYIAAQNLNISFSAKRNMEQSLRSLTRDYKQHNIGELFDYAQKRNNDFLLDAKIETPHQLFSVVAYWFSQDFVFSRPYIAAKGVEILSADDRLRHFIVTNKNYSIRALLDFAKENLITVDNILRVLNTMNDQYYILDKESIIPISSTGITASCKQTILRLISKELASRKCVAIRDLEAFSNLPQINVRWTEWLVYSVINHIQVSSINVITSSTRFKEAIPLVAMVGEDTEDNIQQAISMHDSPDVISSDVDNLDDLDALIEDIIDIDFDWED